MFSHMRPSPISFPWFVRGVALIPSVTMLFLFSNWVEAQTVTGDDVIRRHLEYHAIRYDLLYFEMTRTVEGEDRPASKILGAYHSFEDGSLGYMIRVLTPEEVRGAGVLMKDNLTGPPQQYLFLPEFERTQRIRRGSGPISFLGSDFTYDDLLRELPSHQNYRRLDDTVVDEMPCYVVKATDRLTKTWKAYHHRLLYIAHKDARLLKVEFFEDENTIEKTMRFSDFKPAADLPTFINPETIVMETHATHSKTTLKALGLAAGVGLSEEYFTPRALQTFDPEGIEKLLEKLK